MLALSGCAAAPPLQTAGIAPIDPKYGVRASPRLIPPGQPIPHGGGVAMVGRPYIVAGRTYYPSARPYHAIGLASWYGDAFQGRRTANGEIFDKDSLAAAHPTMPLPSYARVTNTSNGRSVIVRVNDRGPYERNRVMDVSERVADVLDFKRMGTVRVRVDYLGPAGVDGSDDDKLIASLRTDGSAAQVPDYADLPMSRLPIGTSSPEALADAAPAAVAPPEPAAATDADQTVTPKTPQAETADGPKPSRTSRRLLASRSTALSEGSLVAAAKPRVLPEGSVVSAYADDPKPEAADGN